MALLSPEDAEHFLRVYTTLLLQFGKNPSKTFEGFGALRRSLYESKALQNPPTSDPDLLAALKTAVYGDTIVGRHLARYTEMVGPEEKVYRVKGLTDELADIIPPWVFVRTAVMQFKGHWICDGLIEGGNILIGRNMIREYTEIIRESPPLPDATKTKTRGSKTKRKAPDAAHARENKAREERIAMEIVVDAYNDTERAMGWYCYLEEKLRFPFSARCVAERSTSPLNEGDEVEVLSMAPSEECEHGMFVEIQWQKRTLAVPLDQLEALGSHKATKQAVGDWHYWVARGYSF